MRNNIWWIHFVEIPSSPEESSGWWHWAPPASSWWTTPSSQRRTCWGRRLYRDLSEIYIIYHIYYIYFIYYMYIYMYWYISSPSLIASNNSRDYVRRFVIIISVLVCMISKIILIKSIKISCFNYFHANCSWEYSETPYETESLPSDETRDCYCI